MGDETGRSTKNMRLRYAGTCCTCRMELAAGTQAIYDREAKKVACLDCAAGSSSDTPVPGARTGLGVLVEDSNRDVEPAGVFVGTAGASARRENERRKNKRETRIRHAHPLVGGLILALSDDPQSTRAWETGARGEELLGKRLDGLTGKGAYVLHDRRIPPTRANIDHIVICPTGVYVIDAKKYQGRPTLRVEGGLFRPRTETLVVGSRNCTSLVEGVHKQIDRVAVALGGAGLGNVPVHGMLCFVEADWPLFGGDFAIADIQVLWPEKATDQLLMRGPIDDATAQQTHRTLTSAFPPA